MGARNVLLADGAKKSETLAGVPMLSDPLKSIAYAVHPQLVKDWTWAPTSYSGYTCGVPGGGAGALLRSSFTS